MVFHPGLRCFSSALSDSMLGADGCSDVDMHAGTCRPRMTGDFVCMMISGISCAGAQPRGKELAYVAVEKR